MELNHALRTISPQNHQIFNYTNSQGFLITTGVQVFICFSSIQCKLKT